MTRIPKTKVCTKCEKRKQLEAFSCNHRHRDGLSYHCRTCAAAKTAAWRIADPARHKASQRTSYYANREARIAESRRAYYANHSARRAAAARRWEDPHYRAYWNERRKLHTLINGGKLV